MKAPEIYELKKDYVLEAARIALRQALELMDILEPDIERWREQMQLALDNIDKLDHK